MEALPTRANVDQSDPRKRFLPAFVGMNHVVGAMLAFPLEWWESVSEHLAEYGAMMRCPNCGHEQPETIRHRLRPGEEPMLGAAGEWVPVGEDDGTSDDKLQETLDEMRAPVKRELLKRLRAEFPNDPVIRDMDGEE